MDFKKCVRCGSFFVSDNNICSECACKDRQEISLLNNFIEENNEIHSIQDLSDSTGITLKNINRYIDNNSLENF